MATTTNYGWEIPDDTDLVKDGAAAIRELGQDIDTTVFALPAGALELISTTALTASSGVSLTSLAVGTRYKIIWRGYTSADNIALYMRFRENSTDKATGYSGGIVGYQYLNSNQGTYVNAATQIEVNRVGTTGLEYNAQFTSELVISSLAQAGILIESISNYGFSYKAQGISNADMSNCNGISIFPSSGTMTGSISIYKYNV